MMIVLDAKQSFKVTPTQAQPTPNRGDLVTGNKGSVSGTDLFGVVDKFESKSDQRKFAHGSTKSAGVFNDVKALLQSAATNAVGIKVNSTENGVKFTFIRDNRN